MNDVRSLRSLSHLVLAVLLVGFLGCGGDDDDDDDDINNDNDVSTPDDVSVPDAFAPDVTPPTDFQECEQLFNCIELCSPEDEACQENCRAIAGPDAEQDYDELRECADTFCADAATPDLVDCLYESCAEFAEQCLGPPVTPPTPADPPDPAGAALCTDTCEFAADGECDDGGPGALYNICAYGTDCTDCGPRTEGVGECINTCPFAADGECDDGGQGADYNICPYGSDCTDCGPR